MKFAKLSMAAIAVVGFTSSAMAFDKSGITINPFGSAKLYYETVSADVANSVDLFDKGAGDPFNGATGQALLSLGATGAINNCLGYGIEGMAVDTLGLENNLVSNTRMGNGRNSTILDTQFWFPQAYVTYSPCDTFLSNTTFKVGRQYLDTPLAFTENWNIAPNSFDAAVIVNKDIINTTLIAAYVGRGNGTFGRVTNGDNFTTYGKEGAYAVGAITSLLDGALPISVWGYDVVNVANAVWADAGYKLNLGDGINLNLGGQYAVMMPDDDANSLLGATADDTSGFGVKVGTSMKVADMNIGLMAAYSSVDSLDAGKTGLGLNNTATGGKKTKLYTAGIYTDGTGVAQPGSDAFKVKASTKVAGLGSLAVQYVSCENDDNAAMHNVDEIDVILGTSLPGGIGAKLIYMNRDVDVPGAKTLENDTDHVRVILSKKF